MSRIAVDSETRTQCIYVISLHVSTAGVGL